MKIIECPYCKKVIEDSCETKVSTAIANCESYDNTSFTLRCPHCKKIYGIYLERIVSLVSVHMTNAQDTSFG